jgi:hypothetical protein
MTDAKPTPGPVEYIPCQSPKFDPDRISVRRTEQRSGDDTVLTFIIGGPDAQNLRINWVGRGKDQLCLMLAPGDADPIADEHRLTPRQLAEQRSSLLDACKNLRSAIHSCDLSERDREILKPWLRQATNAIVAAKPEGHA